MSLQMTLFDSLNAISSPASEGGATPCASPDGRKTDRSGPDHVPASHSVLRGKDSAKKTSVICGPCSGSLYEPVNLPLSLENKSPARQCSEEFQGKLNKKLRLRPFGSMEYSLTWKTHTTPAGRQIFRLRASARRISDNDCSGWPTPCANDGEGGGNAKNALAKVEKRTRPSGAHYSQKLRDYAFLAVWATPSSLDWRDTPGMSQTGTNPDGTERKRLDQLPRQAALGTPSNSSPALMEKRGALNPAHARWLMGYPAEWDSCGAMAMQSCRKSQQSSSRQQKRQ